MPSSSAHDQALFHLSPQDPVTIKQAYEGIFCFGSSGAGKSSGPGKMLLLAMLRAGFGVLALTTKRGESQALLKMAAKAGREKAVILFGPDHPHCLNALDHLYRAPSSRGGAISENVVAAIMTLIEARERGRGQGSDPFWLDSAKQLCGCAIDLLGIRAKLFPSLTSRN
jgi:hypothetical protein